MTAGSSRGVARQRDRVGEIHHRQPRPLCKPQAPDATARGRGRPSVRRGSVTCAVSNAAISRFQLSPDPRRALGRRGHFGGGVAGNVKVANNSASAASSGREARDAGAISWRKDAYRAVVPFTAPHSPLSGRTQVRHVDSTIQRSRTAPNSGDLTKCQDHPRHSRKPRTALPDARTGTIHAPSLKAQTLDNSTNMFMHLACLYGAKE